MKALKNIGIKIATALLCFGIASCQTYKTQYNLVVPRANVIAKANMGTMVQEKYCTKLLFGLIPVAIEHQMDTAANAQKTIERANAQGIRGNALANVTFRDKFWFFPLVWAQQCMIVEGNMVQI